jgi:hypothetical protein
LFRRLVHRLVGSGGSGPLALDRFRIAETEVGRVDSSELTHPRRFRPCGMLLRHRRIVASSHLQGDGPTGQPSVNLRRRAATLLIASASRASHRQPRSPCAVRGCDAGRRWQRWQRVGVHPSPFDFDDPATARARLSPSGHDDAERAQVILYEVQPATEDTRCPRPRWWESGGSEQMKEFGGRAAPPA